MDRINNKKVLVVGAGLAGVEASWLLANQGVSVVLCEAKTCKPNPSQRLKTFAELVCSNSLKSTSLYTAHGLLKAEMQDLGSLVLKTAYETSVPAGGSLSVDRKQFSEKISCLIGSHPRIKVVAVEVTDPLRYAEQIQADFIIIAAGPLLTPDLERWISETLMENSSSNDLYFYDAIAPIVDADSLDFSKLYFKDRYDKNEEGVPSYANAPFSQDQYVNFVHALTEAEKVPTRNFEEERYFEGCLPVDIMAKRGIDTLRFSCMKPVGLELPDGKRPYAVVQLRRENLLGSAYNLVGFQTRLTHREQVRIFRMIPGFENAEFLHLGSIHRNSFIDARKILNSDFSVKLFPQIYFAGQICGVEGYTESSMSGLVSALQVLRKIQNSSPLNFPTETMIGGLINYLFTSERPAPSNVHYGLLPPVLVENRKKNS